MTAQQVQTPLDAPPIVRWRPDPVRQARADLTLEDLLTLPADAPRKIELIDGRMIVPPSPTMGHQNIAYRLRRYLDDHAPPTEYDVTGDVGVTIGPGTVLEPDVVLLRSPATREHHYFDPSDVVLVAEVVSPSTKLPDRRVKPGLYGRAGIVHYWRVEQAPALHVYAYQLGPDGAYKLVADSDELVDLDAPFPIALRVTDLSR